MNSIPVADYNITSFRVDSVMSNNPEVAQIESQKVRTLRLFVNTITFDEFVGSGLKFLTLQRKISKHSRIPAAIL